MRRLFTVLSVMIAVTACSDSEKATGPEGVTIADLVGSWTASSLAYTNNANPGEKLDLIPLGAENRVTVLESGGARTWLEFGTVSDEWDALLTISGTTLTSRPAEASRSTRSWAFTLEGNVLTLTDANWKFDFTLADGTEVSATEVVVLVKQ